MANKVATATLIVLLAAVAVVDLVTLCDAGLLPSADDCEMKEGAVEWSCVEDCPIHDDTCVQDCVNTKWAEVQQSLGCILS
ncbi:hypothetical protein Syun_007832 [Stephania yunnanensis]|uniref:Uncharacterized protein n=1 Tax=Stephania yunnanensis TaxID=152371 RepID=A0AAP0KZF6_9MAGN